MRFASLGSGSRGNAWVVAAGRTTLLVDCGFGPRNLAERLGRLSLSIADISAVLVTHEHSDHVGGVAACARRHRLPVFLTSGTLGAVSLPDVPCTIFDSHTAFTLGDLEIRPFPVPHDAREPVQFVLSDGDEQLGILTDTGHVTPHILDMLSGCSGLVVECNHDASLLAAGRYPPSLKQRIAGRYGHLDNNAAAELLSQIGGHRLRHVVAAHLSQENNRPDLAAAALAASLNCDPAWICVADQDTGLPWLDLHG